MPHLRLVVLATLLAGATACPRVGAPTLPKVKPDVLRITFIDVGQGDAILIQDGDVDLLVDTGETHWAHLEEVLSSVSGDLDGVFLTHPHHDHYGQLPQVLERLRVRRFVTNGEAAQAHDGRVPVDWQQLEETLRAHGLSAENLSVGATLEPAPGLRLTVLATGSPTGGEFRDSASGENINNDSLVLRLEYAGRSVLLTGDIGSLADQMLIDRYCGEDLSSCGPLRADILKVPHHGSADFTPRLFDAVKPSWAVVSADYSNERHCLPRAELFDALAKRAVKVFSTSAEGVEDVVVEIDRGGDVRWQVPTAPIFAWRKEHKVCSPESIPQGLTTQMR